MTVVSGFIAVAFFLIGFVLAALSGARLIVSIWRSFGQMSSEGLMDEAASVIYVMVGLGLAAVGGALATTIEPTP